MSENVFPHYRTDTFAMTTTGMNPNFTVDVTYVRKDHEVTLHIPAMSGTSNAVTFTLTGLPAHILPTFAHSSFQVVIDNNAQAQGVALMAAGGSVVSFGEGGFVAGGFTNSSTKGLPGNALTYLSVPGQ